MTFKLTKCLIYHIIKDKKICLRCVWIRLTNAYGKSILQVPDTGTRVLDNTRPFLCSSIVNLWITLACFKERKYHIFGQYWYSKYVPVLTNTGTFQYLGPEVCFFHAYLLCAREFRQNNALQFWCLSNALTLRVCALDTSKSQRACIILSKFTRNSKYAFITL